jgi:DNA-directed RNA polymerase specialized sigma24 family protein
LNEQQQVIVLFRLLDFSARQIARRLEVRVAVVMSQLRAIRNILRDDAVIQEVWGYHPAVGQGFDAALPTE